MEFEGESAAPGESFKARAPWFGGDLQTLRNFLVGRPADLSAWPGRRLELELADGSGDRLLGTLHGEPGRRQSLAVLIHGLTGCQDSLYLLHSARCLLEAGFAVLRLNLRGAGPGRPLARQQYHAGRSADLHAALKALSALRPGTLEGGLFLAGFSLGANMLLKFLAKEGEAWPIRAAASVSAPIDLRATQERIMLPRNRLYHAWLLRNMRRELLATPGGLEPELRAAAERVRDVFAFDDEIVAPRNGFAGALDYYRRSSAVRYLGAIETPTLLIHAANDPWIPVESYLEGAWRKNPKLKLRLAPGGGHVGFHGAGSLIPWHDRKIVNFFNIN